MFCMICRCPPCGRRCDASHRQRRRGTDAPAPSGPLQVVERKQAMIERQPRNLPEGLEPRCASMRPEYAGTAAGETPLGIRLFWA
jgi:hypothetical protein